MTIITELHPRYGHYSLLSKSANGVDIQNENYKLTVYLNNLDNKFNEAQQKKQNDNESLKEQKTKNEEKTNWHDEADRQRAELLESRFFSFLYVFFTAAYYIMTFFIDLFWRVFKFLTELAQKNITTIVNKAVEIFKLVVDKIGVPILMFVIFVVFLIIIIFVICKLAKLDCSISGFINNIKNFFNGIKDFFNNLKNADINTIKNAPIDAVGNFLGLSTEEDKKKIIENSRKIIDYNTDIKLFTVPTGYNPVDYMKYYLNNISQYVSTQMSEVMYGINLSANSIQDNLNIANSISDFNDKYDRALINDNRSNDINNIKTDYITDKKLLGNKDVPINNVVIDIKIPKNIDWKMNNLEYINKNYDYSKLPESILNSKNENDLSLDDKKNITIPYKVVNNTYQLSCNDSYFTNNVSEKANILKDNEDNQHCSINNDAKIKIYNTDKKREKESNDLSVYN